MKSLSALSLVCLMVGGIGCGSQESKAADAYAKLQTENTSLMLECVDDLEACREMCVGFKKQREMFMDYYIADPDIAPPDDGDCKDGEYIGRNPVRDKK